MRIRKVLCPVDFSEPARAAMHAACDLAQKFGARLTLLHIYQVPAYPLPEGVLLPTGIAVAEMFDRIDQGLDRWRSEAEERGCVGVEALSDQGNPWHRIVEHAREGDFDLIVMGTHGHGGIRHLILGSVAERVVRHAPCPVMTVQEADERLVDPPPAHAT